MLELINLIYYGNWNIQFDTTNETIVERNKGVQAFLFSSRILPVLIVHATTSAIVPGRHVRAPPPSIQSSSAWLCGTAAYHNRIKEAANEAPPPRTSSSPPFRVAYPAHCLLSVIYCACGFNGQPLLLGDQLSRRIFTAVYNPPVSNGEEEAGAKLALSLGFVGNVEKWTDLDLKRSKRVNFVDSIVIYTYICLITSSLIE